jgi:hypothetical protein
MALQMSNSKEEAIGGQQHETYLMRKELNATETRSAGASTGLKCYL